MNAVNLLGVGLPTLLARPGTLVVLGVVLVLLVIFYWRMYRVEGRRLTGRQRLLLWALRLVVAGLVILMLGKPAMNVVLEERHPPVVALVLDESGSMAFPGERNNELIRTNPRNRRSRYDGAKKAIDILQRELTDTHRVKVFTTSDALRHVSDAPNRTGDEAPMSIEALLEKAQTPTGTYSNLGEGVAEAVRVLQPFRTSALFLVADGRVTGGTPLVEAGNRARDARIPVSTLTFGADRPLRDLRIDQVDVPVEASLGDLLIFTVTLTNYIRHNLNVELLVREGAPGQEPKLVRRRPIEWRRMGQKKIRLFTIPDVEGERIFTFSLPTYEDEINRDNNEATVTVKVVKRGLRLLLIGGRPTLEYHYLVPALLRDPIVKLSCFLQSSDVDYIHQGNAGIDRLPRTTKEWNEFDVVILADPDPKGLSSRQISGLEQLVRNGGGLLVLAGRCFGLDMLLQVHPTKMADMLPVTIDKNEHPDYARLFASEFRAERTTAGARHPVMITTADQELNERIWSTFPTFYWSHPVVDAKSESTVLLERQSGRMGVTPLMALKRHGRGAVFYSGLNSIWRWRYPCESYDYDRFWTRAIRYLGETRLSGTQKQVALSTDKRVYAPGEMVTIILRVLDPALMNQLRQEKVFVTVIGAGGQRLAVPLRADPLLDEYTGTYEAKFLGRAVIHARHVSSQADSEGKPLFDVKHSFDVKLRSLEEIDTSADLEGMRELAEKTGGRWLNYQTLNERALKELADSVPTEPQVLTKKRIIDIWDTIWVLLLFLVLASTEWSLRKLWGVL